MHQKWQDMYKSKLKTADEAVAMIRDNEVISSGFAVGHPVGIFQALTKRVREGKLHNPTVLAACIIGESHPFLDPSIKDLMEFDSFFVGLERQRVNTGCFTYSPVKFGDLDTISGRGLRPVQVSVLRVSPMDSHGFFSTGVSVDFAWSFAKSNPNRRLFILEVNNDMPRTYGNNHIHISEVDVVTEHHTPLTNFPTPPPRKEWEMMAGYIADMVPDGATIQLGYGGLPGAVGNALKDKRDLGVHSEVIPDVMVDLYEAGAITCNKKTYMPHKWVGSFATGTEKVYNFVKENPMVEMHTVGVVNNPYIIAQNDNMISINATLQMDLTGQCVSESIGPIQYSCTGGQVDFVQGAWMSNGGKSFICLESTVVDKNGQRKSKIVPQLYPGSFITTSRTEVQWVVTEYGAEFLKGQSIKSRVEKLISIAHPDFRDELRFAARKLNYIR
jgi:4-hydroxybutyrate CoA-transferase